MMRAIQYSCYDGGAAALQHVEVGIPEPKVDEVLIKVEAIALNAADWKIQEGMVRPFFPLKFPMIPGTDISGEVVKVGSSITKLKIGDKVVALLSSFTGGALAEYAVAKENLTLTKPPDITAPECAALPLAALTAYQALTQSADIKLDGSSQNINILVTGASGGVGHYAVQLAKLSNAHVTATCGARNLELVKSLGADEVLDYQTPEGTALKSPSGKKYDIVIHCATKIPWETFVSNLNEPSKVICVSGGFIEWFIYAKHKLTFSKKVLMPMVMIPKRENFQELVNLVQAGKLKSIIDSKHSLGNVEDGWSRIMSGHATGKVIVEP
ncbi:quinone-oxidoreductase homolog, chloroplastic-like [Amaranthus tricolor]|uniref:quinone-oxidoreductase homolog, chloroplastic-like n=1 Tax=Amaranthus tricolor TaxID=29722 RepID=UPI002584B2DD|nr:quinone-oxidoreductase homolog, chloroplastic-like [Amaranthus tricolor]